MQALKLTFTAAGDAGNFTSEVTLTETDGDFSIIRDTVEAAAKRIDQTAVIRSITIEELV